MGSVTERRSTPGVVELRAGGDGGQKIGGYAIVYGRYSQNLGGYVEMVEPGFVDQTLSDGADVLCRYQHDSGLLLGRTSASTLRLQTDDTGLEYEADLPDTSYARDVAALAARGDVRHSSFAFRCMPDGDRWDLTDQGTPVRILKRGGGKLVDVAPVVSPAYLDTSSGLRSLAEHRGLDLDVVTAAAAANELGELIRAQAPTVIDVAARSGGTTAGQGPGPTHSSLAVHRRRLALLGRRSL